jgi:hypothetical protein
MQIMELLARNAELYGGEICLTGAASLVADQTEG